MSNVLHVEDLESPAVYMTLSGPDSILVYTYENVLHHYILVTEKSTVKLLEAGQIALHGIIRAPARVRAINWIVPDEQQGKNSPYLRKNAANFVQRTVSRLKT